VQEADGPLSANSRIGDRSFVLGFAVAMSACSRTTEPTVAPMVSVSSPVASVPAPLSPPPRRAPPVPDCPGAKLARVGNLPYMARILDRMTLTGMPDLGDAGTIGASKGVRYDPVRRTMTAPAVPAQGFVDLGKERYAMDAEGLVTIPALPATTTELPLTNILGTSVIARLPLDPCGFGVTNKADAPTIVRELRSQAPGPMN
jgi:hypothetical protein